MITAYQSEVFVADGVTTQSYVQPGSQFTSRNSTSSATADISLTIVLFQTPITCDPTLFKFLVTADATTSAGSLTGPPDCVEDSSLSSVNLTFKFPAPLSFSPTFADVLRRSLVGEAGRYTVKFIRPAAHMFSFDRLRNLRRMDRAEIACLWGGGVTLGVT